MFISRALRRPFCTKLLKTPAELRQIEFSNINFNSAQLKTFLDNSDNYTPLTPTIERLNKLALTEPALVTDNYLKGLRQWGYLLSGALSLAETLIQKDSLSDEALSFVIYVSCLYPIFIKKSESIVLKELKQRIENNKSVSNQLIADLSYLYEFGQSDVDPSLRSYLREIDEILLKLTDLRIGYIQTQPDQLNQFYELAFSLSRQIIKFVVQPKALSKTKVDLILQITSKFIRSLTLQAQKDRLQQPTLTIFRKFIEVCAKGEGVLQNLSEMSINRKRVRVVEGTIVKDRVQLIIPKLTKFATNSSLNNILNTISLSKVAVHFAVYSQIQSQQELMEGIKDYTEHVLKLILGYLRALKSSEDKKIPEQLHEAIVDYICLCDRLEVCTDGKIIDSIFECFDS